MCDEHVLQMEAQARREKGLSRRDFNLLALSAAAVAMLPGGVLAASVKKSRVNIETGDGMADAFFVRPAKGQHPGVLLWPDFMGLRPAYEQLASKLAQSGYAVLAVNPYYRSAKSPIIEKADFENKAAMEKFGAYSSAITRETLTTDAEAFVGFLDRQSRVDRKRKIGAMGYCMSGAWTFHTAATVPERVGAIASFHGGQLVSEDTDSLQRVLSKIRVQALIAISRDDDESEPQTKTLLREAFAKAGLPAEIEVYPAAHGWCTPDMLTLYDEVQAQRAWVRLLTLFERAL